MKLILAVIIFTVSSLCYANEQVDPCENPRNRLEFAACDKYKYDQEDQRLNDVYSKLMQFSKGYFNIGNQTGENVANKLKEAQRAWIQYRDANCKYEYNTYYPGSQASNISLQCKLRMTKARADELQKKYDFWSSR